jgi:signal transduction histidine kinase
MTSKQARQSKRKIHPALSRSYWIRTLSYSLGAILVLSALPPGPKWISTLVVFFGFIYPTLFYQVAIRMRDTRRIGFAAYAVDAFLWSLAVIACHYSIAILIITPLFCVVSAVLMLGPKRGLLTFAGMVIILLIGLHFIDPDPFGRASITQGVSAWIVVMAFMFYIAYLVNQTTRSFVATRRELQEKNAQITAQTKQLESISNVAQLVNSTLDIDQVMKTVMERLSSVFSFTHTAILFLDTEKQVLHLDRMGGDVPAQLLEKLQSLHIPLTEEYSAFTITVVKKNPVYVANVAEDTGATEGRSADIYKLVPSKSLLTFPLVKDDEVFGVLAFTNTEDYFHLTKEDIDHIGQYVTYVVSALSNARNYREIQESRAIADAANHAKSRFLANMSHELRTPMNAIIGYTEMLEEEAEDRGLDEMIPDLKKVLSSSHHLLELINDVLDLSKVEAGKSELLAEKFNGDNLLAEIEATVKPLIEKNDNQLRIQKVNELGDMILDQSKLRQIILNLLSNAAKFTHEDVIRCNCERIQKDDSDWLIIKVIDSGIGMTPEQLERVFEPFSQAEASTTREYGGTGLGLSISRTFCELMGGTLTAESEAGAGSVFVIQVPIGLV